MLKLNVPMAMKIAFDGLKDSEYKTRDPSISDVGKYEKVELSILLCNDDFIRTLNKDWRGEDHATDVLSMSQHIPELDLPIVRICILVKRIHSVLVLFTFFLLLIAFFILADNAR
jgi:ssRNA-specific RNase YbeY (16S rRNA maturation enzyme)